MIYDNPHYQPTESEQQQRPLQTETEPKKQEFDFSAEAIWEDNRSDEANERRQEWRENRDARVLDFISECDDSRLLRGKGTNRYSHHAIANGFTASEVSRAANSEAVKQVIVIGHGPCGGLNAKAGQVKNGEYHPGHNNIRGYVSNDITDPHVDYQATSAGLNLASQTDKPIAVIAENTFNHKLRLITVFVNGRRLRIPLLDEQTTGAEEPYLQRQRDYATFGRYEAIPEGILKYLADHEQERQALHAKYPTLVGDLRVQNPPAVLFSTALKGPEVWIPNHTAIPGKIFRLTAPREKIGTGIHLSRYDIDKAWAQQEYALSHAAHNHGTQKDFAGTNTLIIATNTYDTSRQVAEDFLSQKFPQPWLKQAPRNIVLAEIRAGEMSKIGKIEYKMRDGKVNAARDIVVAQR